MKLMTIKAWYHKPVTMILRKWMEEFQNFKVNQGGKDQWGIYGRRSMEPMGTVIDSGLWSQSSLQLLNFKDMAPASVGLVIYTQCFLFLIIFSVEGSLGSDSSCSIKSKLLLQVCVILRLACAPYLCIQSSIFCPQTITYDQQKQTQEILFMYVHILIHTHLTRN